MNSKIERMTRYNMVGIVMNAISAVGSIVAAIIFAILAVNVGNLSGGWLNGIGSVDGEGLIAGYEILSRLFGGVGGVIITVIFIVLVLIVVVCAALSIAALVLGIIWNKKYANEESQDLGKGNQIAQLVINGVLAIGLILSLIGSFNVLMLIRLIFSLVICYCHYKCLSIIKE